MASYSDSPLVTDYQHGPNYSSRNGNPVEIITIHCTAGNEKNTAKTIIALPWFQNANGYTSPDGKYYGPCSCNYAVGGDGSIGLCVSEEYRSWCSSSTENDKKAVTIEVASNTSGSVVTDEAYQATILLCADICRRNGIDQLKWLNDQSIGYSDPSRQNMTVHRWFASKSCPGPYLFERLGEIADSVNTLLGNPSQYAQLVASRPMSAQGSGPIYVPRLTRPETGNKYYITKGRGGYSNAIKGSPTDKDCDVLANCVGYAYGRFNEIGSYGECRYLTPTNAENFIEHAGGLEIGQDPKLGACMVWQKGPTLNGSDGAGHVAIVEVVKSKDEITTSESGWNSAAFWTKDRTRGDGNWGASAGYKFRGFIYNPAVADNAYVAGTRGYNSGYTYVSRKMTFADIGIDESRVAPYIMTVDPSVDPEDDDYDLDYDLLKEAKVSGLLFYAGQRYAEGTHLRRNVFRGRNLRKQVEDCLAHEMQFALYAKVMAEDIDEAKDELQQLYFTVSRYPPGLGLWLDLCFARTQSIETNDKILEFYYSKLSTWGLFNGVGLYVTEEKLNTISWGKFYEQFQLWLRKPSESDAEINSVGTVIEPNFFKSDAVDISTGNPAADDVISGGTDGAESYGV